MFSLQKFLSKDSTFFDLLEGSAVEARASVQSLNDMLKLAEDKRSLEVFVERRRNDKRITKELSEHLCKTFVTPLEREDIEALARSLYKIPKTIEKFSERLLLAPEYTRGVDWSKQLEMLDKAGEIVVSIVKELRKGVNLQKVKDQNDQLQFLEGQADKLMLTCLGSLYMGTKDPVKVVVLKDLYELIEKVFDRCRDVGNIVFQIVLKHS